MEGVQDHVSRLFSENFQKVIGIELKPNMIQHSLWALWTCIFAAYTFIFGHFAITCTHVHDLDCLENGAGENCVMNISFTDQ